MLDPISKPVNQVSQAVGPLSSVLYKFVTVFQRFLIASGLSSLSAMYKSVLLFLGRYLIVFITDIFLMIVKYLMAYGRKTAVFL